MKNLGSMTKKFIQNALSIFEKTSKVLATTYGTFLVLQILFHQLVMRAREYLLGVKKDMLKILVA